MPIEEENIKGLLSKWGLAAKPCDSCSNSAALLYCRFDSAFLCISCDSKIHSKLSNHERVWICEVCEQAPAVVTCKADAAVLCSSCDRDIHSANPLALRHERLPVVPFFETPSDFSSKSSSVSSAFFVGDVLQTPCSDSTTYVHDSWMIPNLQDKVAAADFVYSSDVDSLLESGSVNFSLKRSVDSVVPIQAKSINLNHLNYGLSNENCFEIDFTQSKLSPFNLNTQCISQSISSSDVGIVPDENTNSMSEVSNFPLSKSAPVQPMQLSRFDREARVMRYREKRKNRKFEKTIRYASRKAYAEARPRIKGRFAKRTDGDGEGELDQIYKSSARAATGGFLVEDDLYGVVPSF